MSWIFSLRHEIGFAVGGGGFATAEADPEFSHWLALIGDAMFRWSGLLPCTVCTALLFRIIGLLNADQWSA